MNVKYFKILLIIALALCLSLVALPKSTKNEYISITRTCDINNTLYSEVYTYNIMTNVLEFKGKVPYTSQYPIARFDSSTNSIYYSHRTSTTKGDQLWVVSLDTLEHKQLTTDLWSISDILIIKGNIYLSAAYKDASNTHHRTIVNYDPQTSNFSKWWDTSLNDTAIKSIKYFAPTNSFYLTLYSWSEFFNNIEDSNNNNPDIVMPPKYTTKFFSLEGEKQNTIHKTSKQLHLFALNNSQNTALISTGKDVFDSPTYSFVDMDTLEQSNFSMFTVITDAYFLNDYEIIILGEYNTLRGLYKYNINTNEVNLLLPDEQNKYINNFSITFNN